MSSGRMLLYMEWPERPSEAAQRDDLLSLLFAQDIAHSTERNPPPSSMSRFQFRWPLLRCPSLAGFQPTPEEGEPEPKPSNAVAAGE